MNKEDFLKNKKKKNIEWVFKNIAHSFLYVFVATVLIVDIIFLPRMLLIFSGLALFALGGMLVISYTDSIKSFLGKDWDKKL